MGGLKAFAFEILGWPDTGDQFRAYGRVAESQFSAIFPSWMRNMSNHVVLYGCPLESLFSWTKLSTTRSPCATIEITARLIFGSIVSGPPSLEKYALNPATPVSGLGLCWM